MQLHQINQLRYPDSIEQLWPQSLQEGDSLLLLEEAILRCTTDQAKLESLIKQQKLSVFYLASEVAAYGIQPTVGTALSDEEWVNLTLHADSNISW